MNQVIRHTSISIGKTEHCNDDFVFARNIFDYRALGILGDFTSDGPRGANRALMSNLEQFVNDREQKWREMLLPDDRLLPLIARHINNWLDSNEPGAKTTLIALLWDLREQQCSYISVGDSGLGIVGPQGLRYLREGDRGGLRISAGFLPRKDDFQVEQARVYNDDVLFAFTDGLWENTHTFMKEPLLLETLQGPDIQSIHRQVNHNILKKASRDDDLSVLILKGETMTQEAGADRRNAADIDRQLEEKVSLEVAKALGDRAGMPVTSLEEDLINLMTDARGQYDQLQKQLNSRIEKLIKSSVTEQIKHHTSQVDKSLEDENKRLKDEKTLLNSRLNRLENDLLETRRELRAIPTSIPLEEVRDLKGKKNVNKHKESSEAFEKPISGDQATTPEAKPSQRSISPRIMESNFKFTAFDINKYGFHVYVGFVLSIIVIFMIGIWQLTRPDDKKVEIETPISEGSSSEGGPVNTDAENEEQASNNKPGNQSDNSVQQDEVGAESVAQQEPKPSSVTSEETFQAPSIPKELLTLMDVKQDEFQRETALLYKAVQDRLGQLDAISGIETVVLEDVPGLGLSVALKLNSKFAWVKDKKITSGRIAKIWLQTKIGTTVDGSPGPGTQKAFLDKYAPKLAQWNDLVMALHESKISIPALDKAAQNAFGIQPVPYQQGLTDLTTLLIKNPKTAAYLKIPGCKAILKGNEETELGKWIAKQRDAEVPQPGIPVRILWIASKVGLGQSNGSKDTDFLNAVASFGDKNAEGIYLEALQRWN
ncbi:MAG: SpoIIE family protein phosphatase [Acidobacteriota bacterium]|nr:SpoIIE family protein phosphatase [Acidobacteriota bacterium]